MAGLLDFDFNDPQQAGLLALASGLLSAGAPQTRRVGIGEALAGGLGAMGQAQQNAQLMQRKKAAEDLAMQMHQMQFGQMQQQVKDQEAARQRAAMMPEIIAKFGNDYQGMIRAGVDPAFVKNLAESQNYGLPEVARVEEISGANGEKLKQQLDKQGRKVGEALNAYVAPERIDLGDKITFGLPTVGASFKKGFSPSDQVTMRGQNMTDSRSREQNAISRLGQQTQVINDPNQGVLLVDKATGLTRKTFDQNGQTIPSEAQSKKTAAANNVIPILDQADKLINDATGSYGGMAFDKATQLFGGSTKGAESIAQLKVLEGALMMNQPRMEGPQSDKDVAMYRQMAGQLGDPTVPANIKRAALKQIRTLNEKYATPSLMKTNSAPQDINDLLKKYGG